MKNISALPISRILQALQAKELVIILLLTISLPILIHAIPSNSAIPIGAKLLPIFYAPLIAALLFKPQVSILTALLAPGINYMITGRPQMEIATLLTLELLVFVLFIQTIKSYQIKWIAGPLGYIIAKGFSVVLLMLVPQLISSGSAIDFGFHSIQNGFAGICILAVITFIALYFGSTKHNKR